MYDVARRHLKSNRMQVLLSEQTKTTERIDLIMIGRSETRTEEAIWYLGQTGAVGWLVGFYAKYQQ